MSVGTVNKQTGERIQTAGIPAVDSVLSGTSTNPVQNKVVKEALDGKQDVLTFDDVPTANSNNPVKSGGVYSALAGKQDTLTFDSVPTDGSTNPVESNGVYDALETKQNATDNSLDTTAKTIVGAINEHEGDVSTLKSGLTNYENQNNLNLEVPKRKNVLPFPYGNTTITKNGVTFTVNSDNTVTVSGTATDDTEFVLANASTHTTFYLDNGDYVFNGCPVGGSTSTYYQAIFKNGQAIGYDGGNGVELNNVVVTDFIGCGIWVKSGTVISTPITFSPMIRPKGTSDVYAKFIPSVESRIEAVESGKYKVIASVTADGVKTASELFGSLFQYITGISKSYKIIYNQGAYGIVQKGNNHSSFSRTINYNGTVSITAFDIKSDDTADWKNINFAADGTVTVSDHSSDVITSGAEIQLVVG